MLDADFNAKLGDFGLAEVYEHGCSTGRLVSKQGHYSGVPHVNECVQL